MQGPPSNNFYGNNPASSGLNSSGPANSNNTRWSVSSAGFRQSITGMSSGAHRTSMMLSQRPSPMAPMNNEDYNMLNSSVMGPPTSASRNSVTGFAPRQSFSGGGSRMTHQVSASMNQRDTRPIKDKNYQRGMVTDIVTYLTQSGYPSNVTARTLTQPTNKEFQDIFKYLYYKLEPHFDFQKKLEDEVPILLKTMRYPAADSITRTSLYAVGTPHSWPNMLALLSWMVEVIEVVEKHKVMLDQRNSGNSHNKNRDIDPELDMTQVSPDRALYYYLMQTYKGWMLYGLHNDPDLEEMLARSFRRRQEYAEEQVRHLEEALQGLRHELDTSVKEPSQLELLKKEKETLEKDESIFQRAKEHAEPRIAEVIKANTKLQESIGHKKLKLTDIERATAEVQDIVRLQTMTRAGLEEKLDERNKLRRREKSVRQQLKDVEDHHRALDKRFQDGENKAEVVAKEYNELAVRAGIIPASAKYAGGRNYELRLDTDIALTGSGNIYSIDTRAAERAVGDLRNQLTKEVNRVSSELAALREEYEQLDEQYADESTDLQVVEYKYQLSSRKYIEEKEAARAEAINRQAFVESQEELVQSMIQETNFLASEAERLSKENELLEKQTAQAVEHTNKNIKEVLQHISKAKQQVEQQVGVIRSMASKELEDTLQQKDRLLDIFDAEATIERRRANDQEATVGDFSRELMFSQ